ncbi:MAG: FAD-dependent monooxygenase, partial [Xanthobacteraceae bacterium]
MRTQVGIVGAGPAGLMLAHLLSRHGVESIVLESRGRDYVEGRIRAGLIEHWVRDLLIELGVGDRMRHEGLFHSGIALAFGETLHRIDFLIAGRLANGDQILFEVEDVSVAGIDGTSPRIRFRHHGRPQELACDFIGGCDGFHGVTRPSIPDGALSLFERDYPFGWVGILSESPPPDDELIYAYDDGGFALYTMRSPMLSRLYLQCPVDDDLANWPDERIWQELHRRLGGTRRLTEGRIVQKGITP